MANIIGWMLACGRGFRDRRLADIVYGSCEAKKCQTVLWTTARVRGANDAATGIGRKLIYAEDGAIPVADVTKVGVRGVGEATIDDIDGEIKQASGVNVAIVQLQGYAAGYKYGIGAGDGVNPHPIPYSPTVDLFQPVSHIRIGFGYAGVRVGGKSACEQIQRLARPTCTRLSLSNR